MLSIASWLDHVSLKEMEQIIKRLPQPIVEHIEYNSIINEDSGVLPYFSLVFDELSRLLSTLPTQDLYAGYYLAKVMELQDVSIEPQIFRRARRNYLSFVREYHLYVLLKTLYPNYTLIYDRELDMIGIDFLLVNKRKTIALCTYIASGSSYKKLIKKKLIHQRRKDYDTVHDIVELPINSTNAKILNNYWLYDTQDIKERIGRVLYDR